MVQRKHPKPETPPTEAILLKPVEAAALAGVSTAKAYCMVKDGTWPSLRLGDGPNAPLRIPRDKLMAWIDSRTTGGANRA